MFEDVNNLFESKLGWEDYATNIARSPYSFNTNIENESVLIKGSVPGFSKKDIDITVEDDTLVIKGDLSKGDTDGDLLKTNVFEKRYTLLDDMDMDAAVATCKDGILTLEVPRIVPEKINKTIKIK